MQQFIASLPVHDLGSTEGYPCFVVSKYIDGADLATRLVQSPLLLTEILDLVASVADGLHYAHTQGLVHRDIKPSNLLLDKAGRPYVADFGSALRENEFGTGPRYAGTPHYMSPEQARGEGHRVDGRSDVFSLGIVLYEMLTGRRPFCGKTPAEILHKIAADEVRPVRQIRDSIPREVERVCLKALSKRAADRYTTALDMAEDLRFCLRPASEASSTRGGAAEDEPKLSSRAAPATGLQGKDDTPAARTGLATADKPATPIITPGCDPHVLKVVPKGLRSFDANDADFFLELLGGPRDRYGMPENGPSKEQEAFIHQAAAELAQNDEVVPVRLALFAEMVKNKPWIPSTMRHIGGAEGVGVAFFEETFSSPSAAPHHRLHQGTAQAVLSALLPNAGADIKGHKRSRAELLDASGCRHHPQRFDEVLAILDSELRLVTPVDAGSLRPDGGPEKTLGDPDKCYQLTHDYLVPALCSWLTRKQRLTRRGRAELRLADLTSFWTAKPETRRLPSLLEFAQIRLNTSRRKWSEAQRRLMSAAFRHYSLRMLTTIVVVVTMAAGGYLLYGQARAHALLRQLYSTQMDKVGAVIDEMETYRWWIDPLLKKELAQAMGDSDDGKRLRASLAMLPADAGQADFLFERLATSNRSTGTDPGDPGEFDAIRQALLPCKAEITGRLWGIVNSPPSDGQLLRAAAGLALYAPSDGLQWDGAASKVAAVLTKVSPYSVKNWAQMLLGTKDRLIAPLSQIARNPGCNANERLSATNILADWAADRPEVLTPILMDGTLEQFEVVFPQLPRLGSSPVSMLHDEIDLAITDDPADPQNEVLAQRKARAAIALLKLGRGEKVWPLLRMSHDERIRSCLIHWSRPLDVGLQTFIDRWRREKDVDCQAALLFIFGEYPMSAWPDDQRRRLIDEQLARMFEEHPDRGLHAALQWLLKKWSCEKRLKDAIDRLAENYPQRRDDGLVHRRQWYVNRERQTYVIVDAKEPFMMGSSPRETQPGDHETRHRCTIGRRYGIAASPITKAQFQRFQNSTPDVETKTATTIVRTDDSPQTGMTWFEAAQYCNWLSREDGIPDGDLCYVPNEKGKYAEGMRTKDHYQTLAGYRLPTEAEWEYACRAGTITRFYFGESESLMINFAWYQVNSGEHAWPVGTLKPNDFGLFDMLGNIWVWTGTSFRPYPTSEGAVVGDDEPEQPMTNNSRVVLRGGAYNNLPRHVRAGYRGIFNASDRQVYFGFRPVQTIKTL